MSNVFQNNPVEEAQRAYNPLETMVQRFRGTFGPQPAPRPPPTIEQGDQPPDPLRNAVNSFLPPGSPYPPPRAFQPFIPTSLDRHPSQWGQEEQFPQLPQPFEVPHLAQGLGNWFSQNGSQNVARLAALMGPSAGTFLQSYGQAKELQGKLALEQLRLRTAQMADTLEQESFRYGDVLAAHSALNQTLDPKKMLKPVNGKDLLTDLYETGVEIGDYGKPGSLGSLIESGATAEQVLKFLNLRDARTRDVQKLKQALTENAADDAELMGNQSPQAQPPSPGEAEAAKYLGQPETGGAPAPAVAAGAPAPAAPAAPKLVAGAGGEADTSSSSVLVPGPDGTMVPANTPGTGADTGAPIDAIKHGILSGAKDMPKEWVKTHQKAYNAAVNQAIEANNTLDRIIKNPPKDPNKILPMVRAISPGMAKDVELVGNYQDPASGGVSGTGGSPGTPSGQYSNRLRDLVTLIYPQWNQGNYQQQQIFKHSRLMDVLWRTKDLAPMATQIAGDLRQMEGELRKRGLSSTSVNLEGFLQLIGDDPNFVGLRQDFNAYNQAYNTVVTAGHNTLGGVRLQEKGIDPYAPIATYRRVLQGHMVGVHGMVEGAKDRWETNGGRRDQLPAFDTENGRRDAKIIEDISKWDMNTGALPYNPANPDNDIIVKKAGPWGPAGQYYWTGIDPQDRNDPRNWKPVR